MFILLNKKTLALLTILQQQTHTIIVMHLNGLFAKSTELIYLPQLCTKWATTDQHLSTYMIATKKVVGDKCFVISEPDIIDLASKELSDL